MQGLYYLLLALCSNYPPPPSEAEFTCKLRKGHPEKEILKGRTLKIVTYDDRPFSGATANASGALEGHGLVFEVLETLQEKFGFEYELQKEKRLMGDETSGLLGMLVAKDVDMIAAFLPILPGTHNYVTWGTQLWQAHYYVLMKRPDDSATGSGLLAPFDDKVWILILISLTSVGPIIYLIMWLRIKLCPNDNKQLFPLSSCIWFVYGALMKQGSTLSPLSDSARLLFATWWIFILILTAFYTANLTAFLTLSLFTLPIKEVEDVAKPPHKWFTTEGSSVEYAIKNKDDGDLNVLLSSVRRGNGRFIDTSSENHVLEMLYDGWLYLDTSDTLNRLMFDDYKRKTIEGEDENKRCSFALTQYPFLVRSLAFAYPKGSRLPELFNPIVQVFVESGILKHLLNEDLPDTTICPLNLGNKERKLRNTDLFTTYIVVLAGFSGALIVFCIELLWTYCATRSFNSKSNKLQRLKNNYNKFVIPSEFEKNAAIPNQVQTKINGREYFMITAKEGDKRLIPLRTPSALLFQYGLNYPTMF
ncbi:glutamate receptor ionotropic, delta-2 isoform X1 [Halyomorpha halys]|uniref:glutamate receptor ionotropic, delta-2 isoform X1 n=2 Tax=Halyomorpha halys TaxID=286706 RepID=UPI0006D4F3AC